MRLIFRGHGLFLYFVLAFALVGLMAPAAHAAPGNGAYVINEKECYEDEGYTACSIAQGVVNETITPSDTVIPSGNISFVSNIRFSTSIRDAEGNVLFEQSERLHYHAVTLDEVFRALSSRAQYTFTSAGETCTGRFAFHEANGRIQFEREDFSCSSIG